MLVLKNCIDEWHDGAALGYDDHGAQKEQEGDEQGNVNVLRGFDVAPDIFEYICNVIHEDIIQLEGIFLHQSSGFLIVGVEFESCFPVFECIFSVTECYIGPGQAFSEPDAVLS